MSTIYRLQFLLIAAAAILAAAFPANAQTTLEAVKQKGVLVAGSSAEYPQQPAGADLQQCRPQRQKQLETRADTDLPGNGVHYYVRLL